MSHRKPTPIHRQRTVLIGAKFILKRAWAKEMEAGVLSEMELRERMAVLDDIVDSLNQLDRVKSAQSKRDKAAFDRRRRGQGRQEPDDEDGA